MAKIMGRKGYGARLKGEQQAEARRRKEETEGARYFGLGAADGKEEKKEGENGENGEEDDVSTAIVVKKKGKKYEDDKEDDDDYDPDDYWSREKREKEKAGFSEVTGPDSDDSDDDDGGGGGSAPKVGGPSRPTKSNPSPSSADVSFVSKTEKDRMGDILSMGVVSRGKKKKRKKDEGKRKKKGDDRGMKDILKMGRGVQGLDL